MAPRCNTVPPMSTIAMETLPDKPRLLRAHPANGEQRQPVAGPVDDQPRTPSATAPETPPETSDGGQPGRESAQPPKVSIGPKLGATE